MIIRAFLSHGSTDKPFVQKVADYLGRAAVVYDVFEFGAGDDLKEAILKGLSRSDLFVLFASKNAIERDWVKFEISEAEKALALGALSRAITFIIDPDLKLEDLPDWLKATVIERRDSPTLVAKDIQRHISRRISESRPNYFVGRTAESDAALEQITSLPDPNYRPPLVVYGLNGIGRRTLVRYVARNFLSYQNTLEIPLQEGDLLPEVLLKLTSALARHEVGDTKKYLEYQAGRNIKDLVSEIVATLQGVCDASTLPILYDQGAISTEERKLLPDFDMLYTAMAVEPRLDCVIVTNKRIHASGETPLPSVRVTELSTASTGKLVRLMSRDRGLAPKPAEVEAISLYSRGYPPAVTFALNEAKIYGLPHVLANQSALINFSAEIFVKQLTSDKKITKQMGQILQLLAIIVRFL